MKCSTKVVKETIVFHVTELLLFAIESLIPSLLFLLLLITQHGIDSFGKQEFRSRAFLHAGRHLRRLLTNVPRCIFLVRSYRRRLLHLGNKVVLVAVRSDLFPRQHLARLCVCVLIGLRKEVR